MQVTTYLARRWTFRFFNDLFLIRIMALICVLSLGRIFIFIIVIFL